VSASTEHDVDAPARIDKWLWSVRLFPTRSAATAACRAGNVTVAEVAAKPARLVRHDETIVVRIGLLVRTLRVIGVPRSRVGAKAVPAYALDLTPPEAWEAIRKRPVEQLLARARGAGRPTKRERRQIDRLLDPEGAS
jgi:ribosome-associated heat shock protein Hsp15